MAVQIFQIPMGLRLVQRKSRISRQRAEAYGKKDWLRVGYMEPDGEDFLVTRHAYRCPWCGKEIPAYPWFQPGWDPRAQLEAEQLSMFPKEKPEPRGTGELNSLRCPRCAERSLLKEDTLELGLEDQGDTLVLWRGLKDLGEVMRLGWLPSMKLIRFGPYRESLIIDLKNSLVLLALETQAGETLYAKDITDMPQMESELLTALRSRAVRRKLRQWLALHWQGEFPFSTGELGLRELIQVTVYTGFDREFYRAIPTDRYSHMPDPEFPRCSLGDPEQAAKLMSGFPELGQKSVRRVLSQKPELLFYGETCAELAKVLEDPNLLCRVLGEHPQVIQILASLRSCPGVRIYLEDYGKRWGKIALVQRMEKNWLGVLSQGIAYSAMSKTRRARVLEQKQGGDCCEERWVIDHSVPRAVPEWARDGVVQGVRFAWLRSTGEYEQAGLQMRNCLGERPAFAPPVVIAWMDGRPAAALEIRDRELGMCLGPGNAVIYDEHLERAIAKWCKKYAVRYTRDDY